MDIFESLENLSVSEECFDDIVTMVEAMLSEGYNMQQVIDRAYDEAQRDFMNKDGDTDRLTDNNKRRRELIGGYGDNKKTNLEVKAVSFDDSKDYARNKVSGNNKHIKSGTSEILGARDRVALRDSDGERRQINKAKGRHYRKLKK